MRSVLVSRVVAAAGVVLTSLTATLAAPSAAHAAPVVGGTATLTVKASDVLGLATKGVLVAAVQPATVAVAPSTNTITASFPVATGDADLSQLVGSVGLSGGLKLVAIRGKRCTTLTKLTVDLTSFTVTAVLGRTPLTLADLSLTEWTPEGSQGSFSADLSLTAEGAAALNSALKVKNFAAGQSLGALTTTVTTAAPEPVS